MTFFAGAIALALLPVKKTHLRGMYNRTLELEMERVIEDIHLLLKE